MGCAYGMHGREEKYLQNFSVETRMVETYWKAEA